MKTKLSVIVELGESRPWTPDYQTCPLQDMPLFSSYPKEA